MQVKGTRLWCMLLEYVEDNYYAMFYDPSYHKPRSCAQFAPGCIFGHVNGVLRNCTRVQICSYSRGGANLFAPGCKLCT